MTENKKYDAVTIANYVILKSQEYEDTITNLKIQKILYFLQGAFLIENNRSLIEQPFERWKYGPVIHDVYTTFSQFGYNKIDEPVPKYNIDTSKGFKVISTPFDEDIIDGDDKDLIDRYYLQMVGKNVSELVELTHEQKEWSQYNDGRIANQMAPDYTNEEIKSAFSDDHFKIWKDVNK